MPQPGFWRHAAPLLLASGSATRAKLLADAGLDCGIAPPDLDERALEAAYPGPPEGLAVHLAAAKAVSVSRRHPGRVTLGADQTLIAAGRLFHKPADLAAARASLAALSGRSHRLVAGFALALDGALVETGSDAAEMTMRPLSEAFLDAYLARAGEAVLASVGAYQVEGPGAHLFACIDGAHATILGLPLLPLFEALRRRGWLLG